MLAFAADVEEALFRLHDELKQGTYRHGGYETFLVRDPKLRRIHKASVRDRLLHHAIHRVLYPHFDTRFIFDSYSSRKGKGAHAALKRFRDFAWRLSQNRTRVVWVLKADIRRFFDSVRHSELRALLEKNLPRDRKLHALLGEVIQSFNTLSGTGIPLGNLTSQLFSNVYLHPLDQFVKRELGVQHYIRYADDFVVMCKTAGAAREAERRVGIIFERLKLTLHPGKTRRIDLSFGKEGFDFLGWHVRKRMSGRLKVKGKRIYFLNRWPSAKSMRRVRQKVRGLVGSHRNGVKDVRVLIKDLNPVLRGWGNYFRTGNSADKFLNVDAYTWERLRDFLLRRSGRNLKPGQATTWTDDCFRDLGLHRLRGTIRYPVAVQAAA